MKTIECSRIVVKDPKSADVLVVSVEPTILTVPFPIVNAVRLNGTWRVTMGSEFECELTPQQFDLLWKSLSEKYHINIFDGNEGMLLAPETFKSISLHVSGGAILSLCDSYGDIHSVPIKPEWENILSRQLSALGRFFVEVPDD